uniref:Tripartite motif-containing protein 45 n=1 Tax=Zeugodacus cucurbitae TaxID=28588 RepID=A0A0A1WSU3_ZEUCU
MSSNEYYFDVQRKSYEYEQTYENDAKLSPDTYESASENLLTDYEVVSNEEADEDDTVEVAYRKLRREKTESAVSTKNSPRHAVGERVEHGKLHLSLSAEKISLKSQSEKIDKSNAPLETEIAQQQRESPACRERCGRAAKSTSASSFCPRHRRQQQPQQQQLEKCKPKQYAPISFTIVPINVATQRRVNERKQYENGRDLPEIVLTSFEQQQQQQQKQQSVKALPGFDTEAAPKRGPTAKGGSTEYLQQKQQKQQQQYQQSQQYRSVMLSKVPPPSLPPPPASPAPSPTTAAANAKMKKVTRFSRAPEFTNNHFELPSATTKTTPTPTPTDTGTGVAVAPAAMAAKKLPDAEDTSISEINSQPGSSTSPESLMDNVLSAASSVSVRSSSLSSAGGGSVSGSGGSEILKILNVTQSESLTRNVPHVAVVTTLAKEQQQQQLQSQQQHVFAETKELYDNRSLNLKSPVTRGLSPLMTTTTVGGKQATTTALTPIATTPLQLLSPARTLSPPSPSTVLALGGASSSPSRMGEPRALQPAELIEASTNRSRSPSPSSSILIRVTPDASLFPDDLKCRICNEIFRDPRTLNCLHSFCFQCLVDENFKQDSSIPFWSQPGAEDHDWKATNKSNYSAQSSSPEMSVRSGSTSPSRQRQSSFSFKRKKSLERILLKVRSKSDGKSSESSTSLRLSAAPEERLRYISCKICKYATVIPLGGIRQLPQNFLLVRKIESIQQELGDEVITKVWCSLCFEETNATYHCVSCTLNLCSLCRDSHERQRNTANHSIRNIMELRRARKKQQTLLDDKTKFTLKCGMHPGFEMKAFCNSCLQIACADCLVLLHKGHKHEPIPKAFINYSKLLHDAVDHTRPLCSYAEHSIERMSDIAKHINKKCDDIQTQIEVFMRQYLEAIEVHRKTLLQQVHRARETKVEMILEQQLDLEKRNNESKEALLFAQELTECGSNVEVLSFLNILLKRFEYCQQFKMPAEPKFTDTLHFLPHIRAPPMKAQNDIPLFGIITMQTVEPALCTLQWEGFTQLRLHKRVELLLQSRDSDGAGLCHGGLQIQSLLKYKESSSKYLPVEIADNRDGTYGIGFTPDAEGALVLIITINDKPIKGSPFTFLARNVRPHSGVYHCCTFCSSKGNKLVKCSCEGRMPGYNGCGHGHAGHPGSRHWSCCGNVLESSECNMANKLLNSCN